MLKQTTVFNVSFHLRAIFQKSLENSMILSAALPEVFFFGTLVSLRVTNAAPCRYLSRGPWLVGVVFGPVLLSWMSVVFGPLELISMSTTIGTATIRTIGRELNMLATIRTIG